MIAMELHTMVAALIMRSKLASWKCRIWGHKMSSIRSEHLDGSSMVTRRVCMRCMALVVTGTKPLKPSPPDVAPTLKRDSVEYGKRKAVKSVEPIRFPEMDDFERLKMWTHYLIDEACWRSAPYINADGVSYPFANSRDCSFDKFYAPDNSNFGSRAAWYYETYYRDEDP